MVLPTRIAIALVVVVSTAALVGAAGQESAMYTAAQAEAGQSAYQQDCAGCHMADFSGAFEAPELAGPNFRNAWGTQPIGELFEYIRATMPPEGAGSLTDRTYINIIAYVLQGNGFPAGDEPLPVGATAALASAGQPGAAPVVEPGAPADAPRAPVPPPAATTLFESVTDFVPVSDEMLLNPDPADWLMFRRTYNGWGYSPLDQITRDNVHDLRLAWVWAMGDGNQPAHAARPRRGDVPSEPR